MAEIKKYTEKEKEQIAILKKKLEADNIIAKNKDLEAEKARDKYTLSTAEIAKRKEKEKQAFLLSQQADDFKNVVAIEELSSGGDVEQEALTNLGIYSSVKNTSIKDVKAILEKREVIAAVKMVDFDLEYDIEVIPIPDTNKVYSLTTVENNIFDVPVIGLNEDTSNIEEIHVLKNFIRRNGGNYNLSITGVAGTKYEVIIANETSGDYYNWNQVSEVSIDARGEEYTSTVSGSFKHGYSYYEGIIPKAGRDTLAFNIPVVLSETVYRIGFAPISERNQTTDYGKLPIFGDMSKPLYKITQLPNSSTTIKLADSDELGKGVGDLVINHTPGSKLNSSTATDGKYDIELKLSNNRREIKLANTMLNGIVTMESIDNDINGTEILDIDLTASVAENIGTVKGTITLGKSSLRPSILHISAIDIFSTNQSKT